MASLTNYSEDAWLNHLLKNTAYTPVATVYMVLYTVSPGEAGGGTEVSDTGTNYARQACAFNAAATRAVASSATETFACVGSNFGDVTAIGISDSGTVGAGNLLAYKVLAAPITINAGETLTVAAGAFTITIDANTGMGTYAVHKMLDLMFRNTAYTSPTTWRWVLYTADPTDAGGGTEVTNASNYSRVAVEWNAIASGATANTNTESLAASGGNWGTITAIGLSDSATHGVDQLMFYDLAFTEGNATINDGDTFQVTAGAWTISLA